MSILLRYSRAVKGLLLLMISLILISIGLPFIYLITKLELLLPISQAFTTGTRDIISIITGALIASFIGTFFSIWSHEMELEEIRKQVATGFHHELTTFKKKMQNIQHDEIGRLLSAIKNMIPLYPRDSLYYVLRKEMYSLENDIIENLVSLYSDILLLEDIQESLKRNNSTGYYSPNQIFDLINSINNKIDTILPILEERKKRRFD